MIREPAVAGQFYPLDPVRLRELVQSSIPASDTPVFARGIIAPHAGYVYSGAVAGAVYGAVRLTRRVILLGPNHTGRGSPVALHPAGSWRSPLGLAGVDAELNRLLLEQLPLMREDASAHAGEHSLEVHLPFLQTLTPGFSFSAICIGTAQLNQLEEIGHAISRVISALAEPVLLIASSDMNHYESAETGRRKDRVAIDRVIAVDPKGLFRVVHTEKISMCGFAPTVAALTACVDLGSVSGSLLSYSNSGDVNGDHSSVVGYAGMAIY